MTAALPERATVVRLTAPRRLELQDEPLRAPAAGELLCETLVSVISPGTELAAYTGLPPLRDGPVYPRLQGYCNVARVLACGDATGAFEVGQRVLTFQSHRSHFVTPADEVLLTLPEGVDSDAAATTYLFHLGYNAVLRGGVRAGSRVLVIGIGALGSTAVALAALAGAEVRAVTDHAAAAARALRMGARQAVSRRDAASPCAAWADVIIATTNAWSDWSLALASAAQRGPIAVLGFPGRGEPASAANPLDPRYFYMRQLRIEAVGFSPERPDGRGFARFNERSNLGFLLGEIARGRLPAAELLSGRHPGTQIERAYAELLKRTGNPVTYALQWTH